MARVAILDSGINPKHPHVRGVAGGFNATSSGLSEDWFDFTGHGTAVAGAIHSFAPATELLAIKIFDRALRTNIESIVRGIEWALAQQADILNFSLGTTNALHIPVLQNLLAQGGVWVAAASANGSPAYPGSLAGAIGVDTDAMLERHRCKPLGGMRFLASPYPRAIPGVSQDRNLNGVSFAVANVSGLLAADWDSLQAQNAESAALHLAGLRS